MSRRGRRRWGVQTVVPFAGQKLKVIWCASVELANAVRTSDDVTNPVDGTRYQVRPTGLSITSPGGQVFFYPMIQYWPR
jgi:hypothetical protein